MNKVGQNPTVEWKQPHLMEKERMALAEERASSWHFTQDKVKEVVAALQDLDNKRRQLLAEQGQRMQQVMRGGIVDIYA